MSSCETSQEARAEQLSLCRADAVHFVSTFCCTYDPREPQTALPFDPFPRQADFLRWLAERERTQTSGLVEKSREVGVTWLCVAYALHGWLFRGGFACGFGSRKLEQVDRRGDPDSIFEKLRFALARLPHWMVPAGFDPDRHDNEARLINPAGGASVTGEGGDHIGRGGRKTLYFLDEAAFLERPHLADRSLSQTTRVRIDVSTPNGAGGPFYRRRFSGAVAVFTLHWRDDPRKSPAWYEAEKARLGDPATVAQELDIDYSASAEGVLIPGAWVRAAVGLPLAASGPAVCGLDVADAGGPCRNVLAPRRGPVAGAVVVWSADTTQTAFRARDECERLGAARLVYDAVGVGAGVRGALAGAERPLRFRAAGLHGGGRPTEAVWPDGLTSRERFLNLRAEAWWSLRERFRKTHERVAGGVPHPDEECVSVPDDPQLIAELSLPRYSHTSGGKIKVESKEDMRARGVKSPDRADALVYAFAPEPPRPYAPAAGGTRAAPAPFAGPPAGLPQPEAAPAPAPPAPPAAPGRHWGPAAG